MSSRLLFFFKKITNIMNKNDAFVKAGDPIEPLVHSYKGFRSLLKID